MAMTTHATPFGRHRQERLTFGHGSLVAVPTRDTAVANAAVLANEARPFDLRRVDTWDWGWGGLLLFTLLLFFRPQDVVPLLGSLHLSEAAALIGLCAMVFLNLSSGKPITRVTPELIAVLALGALMLAFAPFSFWPGGTVQVFTGMFMKVMLIFMLMVNTLTSPKRLEKLSWIVVLAFGYVALRACFDYARGVNLVEGDRIQGAGGMFNNPNDLALNMATFLPLALMYVRRPGPTGKRLIAAGISLLMLVAIVLTKSRTGFVGTVIMLGIFLVVSRSLTPTTVIAVIFAGFLALPAMPQSFWARMSSITDASKDSTGSRSERIDLMEQAWVVFLEHPITGVGAGQFQNYGDRLPAARRRDGSLCRRDLRIPARPRVCRRAHHPQRAGMVVLRAGAEALAASTAGRWPDGRRTGVSRDARIGDGRLPRGVVRLRDVRVDLLRLDDLLRARLCRHRP
jgi:O-antigen ligase